MVNRRIPLLDLVAPHLELEEELLGVFKTALRTAVFVGGPMVEDFERAFAEFCMTRYCIGVGSGTDALTFALIAAGVRRGDTVVTVPNTFIATAEAISQAGGWPDFVDIDERTYHMSPEKLQEYLESRCSIDDQTGKLLNKQTRRPVTAIVPVHLYGQMAEMDPILQLVERYGLVLIEDACQAHGAEYFSKREGGWKKAGSMGHAAAFSFYPGKNLGACGEAGAVTTDDEEIARKVRMLRDHGQARKYVHEMEGYNGRLDAIQAGILQIKLRHLPKWNKKRREIASYYGALLAPLVADLTLPFEPPWSRANYHLYVMRAQCRDQLRMHLLEDQIATGVHYPIPLHLQKAFRFLGYAEGDFPVAEEAATEILSLPIYPQLGFEQQSRIAQKIMEFVSASAAVQSHQYVPPVPSL